MNLHALAFAVTGLVNPATPCVLQISAGYNIGPDGTQTPNYGPPVNLFGDVQPIPTDQLQKISGLNQQGTHRKVYLTGNFEGIDRAAIKGGDLLTMPTLPDFPGPTTWLIAAVMEHWGGGGWVCVACTLQLPQ